MAEQALTGAEQSLNVAEQQGLDAPGLGKGLLVGGSVLGAIAASSCCVVPLILLSLGVGGAWMGTVTVLAPYSVWIVAFTLACLSVGFYLVYGKPAQACDVGAACARPVSNRVMKTALWSAALLITVTLGLRFVAPLVLGVS